MDIALTALLFLALLALSIALLRQQQEKAAREHIERSAPLIEPDRLVFTSVPDTVSDKPHQPLSFRSIRPAALTTTAVPAQTQPAAGKTEAEAKATSAAPVIERFPEATEPDIRPENLPGITAPESPSGNLDRETAVLQSNAAPTPESTEHLPSDPAASAPASSASPQNSDWQKDVRSLRQQGQFREAHQHCQAHYPRVQAFQQSMLCLRAQLRTLDSGTSEFAETLGELYRVAVVGDLFRPALLKKRRKSPEATEALVGMALRNLNIAYARIGYRQLALLSKTDCRLLAEHWGEPQKHCHAEQSVDADWQNQLQLFSS